MSYVWTSLKEIESHIEKTLDNISVRQIENGQEKFNQNGWKNIVWKNDSFRRAHLDVVDARDTKGLWMMHFCVFPHLHNDSPIYGYDVIAGKNKITGYFHDFSHSVNENHEMSVFFSNLVSKTQWKKERQLPDWAKAIFTENMIAAGNINEEKEIDQLMKITKTTLDYYLTNLKKHNHSCKDCSENHNRYAHYQRMNPHTPKTMKALGLNDKDVDEFVRYFLFPEV